MFDPVVPWENHFSWEGFQFFKGTNFPTGTIELNGETLYFSQAIDATGAIIPGVVQVLAYKHADPEWELDPNLGPEVGGISLLLLLLKLVQKGCVKLPPLSPAVGPIITWPFLMGCDFDVVEQKWKCSSEPLNI